MSRSTRVYVYLLEMFNANNWFIIIIIYFKSISSYLTEYNLKINNILILKIHWRFVNWSYTPTLIFANKWKMKAHSKLYIANQSY